MVRCDRGFRGVIPADYITGEWDLLIYFARITDSGETQMYPGLWNPDHSLPYLVITTG